MAIFFKNIINGPVPKYIMQCKPVLNASLHCIIHLGTGLYEFQTSNLVFDSCRFI